MAASEYVTSRSEYYSGGNLIEGVFVDITEHVRVCSNNMVII